MMSREKQIRIALAGNPNSGKTTLFTLGFKPGQRVVHRSFGEGVISELTPMGNDVMLKITFDKVGDKLMMAKTASQFMKVL